MQLADVAAGNGGSVMNGHDGELAGTGVAHAGDVNGDGVVGIDDFLQLLST